MLQTAEQGGESRYIVFAQIAEHGVQLVEVLIGNGVNESTTSGGDLDVDNPSVDGVAGAGDETGVLESLHP